MSIEVIAVNSNGQHLFKGLSSDTKGAGSLTLAGGEAISYEVGSLFYETDTGDKFEFRGVAGWVSTDNGSSVPSDRELGALDSIKECSWTEAEDVTRIIVTALGVAGEFAWITWDYPDTPTAVNNLATAGTASTPALRRLVQVGVPREFTFENPLRSFAAIDAAGTCDGMTIEAGK